MIPWMCKADEYILERLEQSGLGPAWKAAYELNRQVGHVRRQCQVLADGDFVDLIQREGYGDQYVITSVGRNYLLGEYDANLRRPTPSLHPPEIIRPIVWRERT